MIRGDVAVGGISPPPRVFWWLPVGGQRHAVHECHRATPTGDPVRTLCGEAPDRPAPPTDTEWLWRTCELCWAEACKIVDI